MIKKAYAQKLKIYHPEDDPQGFQRLREAYDRAIQYSKLSKAKNKEKTETETDSYLDNDVLISSETSNSFDENFDVQNNIEVLSYDINFVDSTDQKKSIEELNAEFISNAKALYDDFFARIEIDNWKKLLDCNAMWDISNRTQINNMFLEFLEVRHYLPQNIWQFLDMNFKWSEQEYSLYSNINNGLMKYIIKQIKQQKNLSYSHFKHVDGIDYDLYLNRREKALYALIENDTNHVELYMARAREIYQGDPNLFFLEGQYFIRTNNAKKAILAFSLFLDAVPDDANGLFHRAKLYFHVKQFEKAIEDYQHILGLLPGNRQIMILLAKCYLKSRNPENARDYLIKSLEINPKDTEAKKLLGQSNPKAKYKLKSELKKDPGNADLNSKFTFIDNEIKALRKAKIKEIFDFKQKKTYFNFFWVLIVCFFVLSLTNYIYNQTKNPQAAKSSSSSVVNPAPKFGTILLNSTDIASISPEAKKVSMSITDIMSLGLMYINNTDSNGIEKTAFIPLPDLNLNSGVIPFGLVCMGKINNEELIFVMDADLLKQISVNSYFQNFDGRVHNISSADTYDFSGTLYEIPSKDMIEAVKNVLESSNISQEITDHLITNKYVILDGDYDFTNSSNNASTNRPDIPNSLILSGLLGVIMGLRKFANKARR